VPNGHSLRAYLTEGAGSPVTAARTRTKGPGVLELLVAILDAVRAALRSRASLVTENLALRQQPRSCRRQ
jgi:hypothetical protein